MLPCRSRNVTFVRPIITYQGSWRNEPCRKVYRLSINLLHVPLLPFVSKHSSPSSWAATWTIHKPRRFFTSRRIPIWPQHLPPTVLLLLIFIFSVSFHFYPFFFIFYDWCFCSIPFLQPLLHILFPLFLLSLLPVLSLTLVIPFNFIEWGFCHYTLLRQSTLVRSFFL
jgi:hypothetical protein